MMTFAHVEPPTEKKIRAELEGMRNIEIARNERGEIEAVKYEPPCENCGKFHKPWSKAGKRCNTILAMQIFGALYEVMK